MDHHRNLPFPGEWDKKTPNYDTLINQCANLPHVDPTNCLGSILVKNCNDTQKNSGVKNFLEKEAKFMVKVDHDNEEPQTTLKSR